MARAFVFLASCTALALPLLSLVLTAWAAAGPCPPADGC
jgi:hypothetical protein